MGNVKQPALLRIPGTACAVVVICVLIQGAASQENQKIKLVGAGSTAPLPIYSRWFDLFEKSQPQVDFSYMPFGSQAGIEMAMSGTANFGGSDVPLTDDQLNRANLAQFPTILMAIVPIYNLNGTTEPLRFSAKALAGIYLGTIKKWNDEAIAQTNAGISLPVSNIVVFHSAGGRGSTYIWSDYLSKVSGDWRAKAGRGTLVRWPVGTEVDGNGNMAKMVKQTPNSIGYVELAYAVQNLLPYGLVQNIAGNFVMADSFSMTAAASSAARLSDFRVSITNPAGEGSYPICSFTWILVPLHDSRAGYLHDFLRWIFKDGQEFVNSAGYARLPQKVVDRELQLLEQK